MNFQNQSVVQESYGRHSCVVIISLGFSEGDPARNDGPAPIVQKRLNARDLVDLDDLEPAPRLECVIDRDTWILSILVTNSRLPGIPLYGKVATGRVSQFANTVIKAGTRATVTFMDADDDALAVDSD
jgi:hypothetical protein